MSTKVFVGNLAFSTTDQALTEAFGKYGEVKSGVIITRGRRSLGYGFVEFATAEQAASAVDKMKAVEINGRQIKVELAKDISEQEAAAQAEGDGPARRRRRAPQENNNSSGTSTPTSSTANTNNAGSNSPATANNAGNNKGPKPRRKRGPKRGNENDSDNTGGSSPAPASNANAGSSERAPREPRPPREPREPRPPREPREPREKVPSKTTLFVANLPFSVTDAQLLQVFNGTKAKTAHVALTRNGRSRGYGFVEFETEADQQEALKSHQGKAIDGTNGTRNLSLTISHSAPNPPAADAPATTN